MATFGSKFTQTIDRVVNEQMDFRMQFFIKVRGMVTYISLKPYRPTTILSMPQWILWWLILSQHFLLHIVRPNFQHICCPEMSRTYFSVLFKINSNVSKSNNRAQTNQLGKFCFLIKKIWVKSPLEYFEMFWFLQDTAKLTPCFESAKQSSQANHTKKEPSFHHVEKDKKGDLSHISFFTFKLISKKYLWCSFNSFETKKSRRHLNKVR